MKKNILVALTVMFALTLVTAFTMNTAWAKDPSLKEQVEQYKQTTDKEKKKELFLQISKTVPETQEDAIELRKIFAQKEWDEDLFIAAFQSVRKIKNTDLDTVLIDILKDEKPFMEKLVNKDYSGKTNKELSLRAKNVEFVIMLLGELKSQRAVPILKEYLNIKGIQYTASEALGKIGDTTASEEMREKAYKEDPINYGGLGLDEAIKVVQDLEDKSKADKWPKIAKQLMHIKNPNAKPYLKRLFNHEKNYVRLNSSMTYINLAENEDVQTIIEMAKNNDWNVRSNAVKAMQRIKDNSFEEVLISLLSVDSDYLVRMYAAKALGYKKVVKAVPYLEKALKDKNVKVRKEAFIALYILTNKKYDFQGKDELIEWKAEREKEHPSFY